jgi:hypothetical protein
MPVSPTRSSIPDFPYPSGGQLRRTTRGYDSIRFNPWRLVPEILARSVASRWPEAREEWHLDRVYIGTPGRCLCGHRIVEHCEIFNSANGNRATVGSCCVKRFLGIPSGSIFAGLRRIARNTGAALNEAVIEHASERGWINAWEEQFYRDTIRKRKLSQKQRAKRLEINQRVLVLVGEVQHADE